MREIEAWCAAQHAGLVTQLRPVDSFPEKTIADAAKRLELEAKRLDTDDGSERLEHQRRLARARTWVDPEGMRNLTARLDPLTGDGTRPGRSEFVAVIDADAPGELGPHRELTLRLPDGTIRTTGPPTRRRSAA